VRRLAGRLLRQPLASLTDSLASAVAADVAARVQGQVAAQAAEAAAAVAAAAPGAHPRPAFPDGHFYSPVVDVAEVAADADRIWGHRDDPVGIDFRPHAQLAFLEECLASYVPEYDYPELLPDGAEENVFYTRNSQFSWLDARTLYALLRHYRPRRMIEIGSGYSSLLVADVNTRFLDGELDFRCVEPYPRPFLQEQVPGITEVLVQRVQDVDPELFASLRAGDVLFIDSSHVSKTGSDVNHLFLNVLPRLEVGVLVHVHDVFFPADYPRAWVTEHGFSWNEQYLVQAFLAHNDAFEVVVGSNYLHQRFASRVADLVGGAGYGGGSLWLRKTR
jgi:predicted O-methyltransferase YrrM